MVEDSAHLTGLLWRPIISVMDARALVRSRRFCCGLSILSLGAAVGLVLAFISSGHDTRQPAVRLALASSPAPPAVTPPTSSAVAEAARTFEVLRQPATPQDSLPATSAYRSGLGRRVGATRGAIAEWLVVAQGQICVTVAAATGSAAGGPAACNSLTTLNRTDELLAGVSGSDMSLSEVVFGLAPDRVSSVTIHFSDGRSAVAPVVNNGFVSQAGANQEVSGFSWTAGGVPQAEGTA